MQRLWSNCKSLPRSPISTMTAAPAAAPRRGLFISPLTSPQSRIQSRIRLRGPFTEDDLEIFRSICNQRTDHSDYPLAASVASNIVVYSGDTIRKAARSSSLDARDAIMNEMHSALLTGPGVFVIKECFDDVDIVNRTTKALQQIIDDEKAAAGPKGDHFAPAGSNDRIWNAFQKHAVMDPESFVAYYANEALAVACEAWLGPGYQITAQTNVVHPGGKAQEPHRDFHLGFQSEQVASRFPVVSQIASQLLTLQLGIAHTAMSVESGVTQLLPFSQHFDYGYLAYRHPEFAHMFRESMIQLPLEKGDALFFNPALFHAAGENRTGDFRRIAQLLQVNACWSRPMETVDRNVILRSTWPHLIRFIQAQGGTQDSQSIAAINAICDGYSFPTNLDKDPPHPNGHCPETQIEWVTRAVNEAWTEDSLNQAIVNSEHRRLA